MIAALTWLKIIPAWAYGLVAIIALGVGIEFHGRAHTQREWDADRAEIARISQASIAKRDAENVAEKARQQEIQDQLVKENQDEVAKNRAYRNSVDIGRLRIPAAICGGIAGTAQTAGAQRSDATIAGTVALPDKIESDLRDLMLEADMVVANCRTAQGFIRDNRMAP